MNGENTQLLQEICRTSKMGMEAAEMVRAKARDEDLREQIGRQEENYRGFAEKAERMLKKNGGAPEPEAPLKKAMLWGSVQMNTLTDVRPGHLAEMLINGVTMGIVDVTKKLNQFDGADAGAKKLAEDYIREEQHSIDTLKSYLS